MTSAGVVEAVWDRAVSTIAVGDEVWYAGDVSRPGTNAEFHAVDERLVAPKPTSLSFAEAAALPLTTITAWESLFERFNPGGDSSHGNLLVLGRCRRRWIDHDPVGKSTHQRERDRHRQSRGITQLGQRKWARTPSSAITISVRGVADCRACGDRLLVLTALQWQRRCVRRRS